MKEKIWTGDENRPLTVVRPCECGCDQRDGYQGVGYITGSDADGNGFTVWIEDEAVFERMRDVIEGVTV